MSDDVLISRGGALKSLGDNMVGGHLVVFGDQDHPDLEKDWFGPETQFEIENGDRRPGYFNHGLDPVIKNAKLGRGTLTLDDEGLYLEAELKVFDADKWTAEKKAEREQYISAVLSLVEEGVCGLSSGAVSHLVRRQKTGKSFQILDWPVGEWSITHQPAEARTRVMPIKAWKSTARSFDDMVHHRAGIVRLETKGVVLAGSEEQMLLTALQSLNSMFLRYVMQCVAGADWESDLYGYDPYGSPMPDQDDDEPIDEQMLRAAFDEYRDTALRAVSAMQSAPEAKSAQALLNVFKTADRDDVITSLKRMTITNFLQTMGSVVAESERRVTWYDHERNIKSGRVVSATNLQTLKDVHKGLIDHAGTLGAMIERHGKASADGKSIALAASEYARFLSLESRLLGVGV